MIDFINIFLCNYSGLLSKIHYIVTRHSRIWLKVRGGGGMNCKEQGRTPSLQARSCEGWDREGGGGGGQKTLAYRPDSSAI